MFAGIIERLGTVVSLRPAPRAVGGVRRLEIDAGDLFAELPLGASVAVNGACLTLADQRGPLGGFDVIPETWHATTLSRLESGDAVNLERSLRVGDRIDGHFVQGHVDGVGTIERIDQADGQYKVWVSAGRELRPYIVRKGSIALDGTSLTIVDVEDTRFSVALIPTTLSWTALGRRKPGDLLNIETDILARLIVDRLAGLAGGADRDANAAASRTGVTWDLLRDGGYVQ